MPLHVLVLDGLFTWLNMPVVPHQEEVKMAKMFKASQLAPLRKCDVFHLDGSLGKRTSLERKLISAVYNLT